MQTPVPRISFGRLMHTLTPSPSTVHSPAKPAGLTSDFTPAVELLSLDNQTPSELKFGSVKVIKPSGSLCIGPRACTEFVYENMTVANIK